MAATCLNWSKYLHVILILIAIILWLQQSSTSAAPTNETDRMALLKFKDSISNDPYGILSSWNDSNHFCNWTGITCGRRHQRVTALDLQGSGLQGPITPYIGNLSFLDALNLQNNSFYGEIPWEIGRLFRLQTLLLDNNTLEGEIPVNITKCYRLKIFYLAWNKLIGGIPLEIGSLTNLEKLYVDDNNLTGGIPPSLVNLSSLIEFSVVENNMVGNIPDEIGGLKSLAYLLIGINKFSGKIPLSLFNLSSLITLSLGTNQLEGILPDNIGDLFPKLEQFGIGDNRFSGMIPVSLSNISGLQVLDISQNNFDGKVPINLGNLENLWWLGLDDNNLGGISNSDLDFLKSLTNSSKLNRLDFGLNNLGGALPHSTANLSNQLRLLYFDSNKISGSIPEGIGNLVNLLGLAMSDNLLTGIIPSSFGNFREMNKLYLNGNGLSGHIPFSIGNLTRLFKLTLYQNRFEGGIPSSLGNCPLQYLDISQNSLSGAIPFQVIGLFSISQVLNLSHNSLTGNLPTEVGNLQNVNAMDLSGNNLSGDIPSAIGNCLSLEYLYLQGNYFQGKMPSSLAYLKGLQVLDLSQNNLSGEIPKELAKLPSSLQLNLSFNNLEGEVPSEGVFKNASALSVSGNGLLCGGAMELQLPPCPVIFNKKCKHCHSKLTIIIVCVVVALSLLLLSSLLAILWARKSKKKSSSAVSTIEELPKVSYRELHQATGGFSPNNCIGSGSFGSVYKGVLDQGKREVAVKVLNLQKKGASKSFISECNALRNIKHRNLVKILTCCSSTDYSGNDFKALVYEFMKNGSLEQWLHSNIDGNDESRRLNFLQRLNAAIDVASALHYLHDQCGQSIVHCDLKPSNILLDEDMVARVADFGLARLLSATSHMFLNEISSIGIKGSIGYAAPEYGMGGEVSTKGDVYSFGILLLEMFTGRRPTDDMFRDGLNLPNYARISLPEKLVQIVDPTLHQTEAEDRNYVNVRESEIENEMDERLSQLNANVQNCLLSVFKIGLACADESPRERMDMRDVESELQLVKNDFLGGGCQCDQLHA